MSDDLLPFPWLDLVLILALIANDLTGPGATLFYGATMLIAAWRGAAGWAPCPPRRSAGRCSPGCS